jgi:hypothetical protein
MSLSSNKSEIFNKIKLYISLANTNNNNLNIDNITSSNDNPLDFIFDLVRITNGHNGFETLTQIALTKVLTQNFLNKISDKIYDYIINNISSNVQVSVPNDKVELSLKTIDPTDELRKSRESQDLPETFIGAAVNRPNIEIPLTSEITVKYIENTNTLETKVPRVSLVDLMTALRVAIGPMFSSSVIINEILNILFHIDFTKEDAEVLTIVRSYTNYENKNGFKMDLKKLLDLESDTNIEGYNIDVSCFRENITITDEQIQNVIKNPSVKSFNVLIPEFETETNTTVNENAKEDYHKKIIKAIAESLLSMLLKQPAAMFFLNINDKIENFEQDLSNFDINDLFIKFELFFENLFDSIYEEILCVLFNWVKKYLIKLVINVTIILLREQLEKRKNILLSLSGAKSLQNIKKATLI